MPRSLAATELGKQLIQQALDAQGWTAEDLSLYFADNSEVSVSRSTAYNFLGGLKVRPENFQAMCGVLNLDWELVSGRKGQVFAEAESPPAPNSGGAEPVEDARSTTAENLQQNSNEAQGIQVQGSETTIVGQTVHIHQGSAPQNVATEPAAVPTKIDEQKIRRHCRKKILQNYSKIRLLSGQEIGVDQLYVDVWLLDRQPRTFQRSASKMLETFDLRNDRLGLGDRMKRNPGFEVANTENKLLILGKPGAGKTTFLKHLSVDWCNGKFQPDLFAVFIEFRRIRDEQWQALDAIVKKDLKKDTDGEYKSCEWLEIVIAEKLDTQDRAQIIALLNADKLLLIMDGFDEVATGEHRKNVQNQLEELTEKYPGNRFILTCRTQIIASVPDGFTSVEVADFNEYQVEAFVKNWFRANDHDDLTIGTQWKVFSEAMARNAALKELSVTPVLLGLTCLVLQDEEEIPLQTGLLYERGINLLLKKWNDAKDIPKWEIGTETYRELNIEQKEDLLIQIAAKKFDDPKNFVLFSEEDLTQHISEELNLPNKSEAKAVLKAIETQHGLLIERADALWSFSHLTFQEYFTTKWLLSLSIEKLSRKIVNEPWQNVVSQLVKAQGQSDRFLRLIKQAIDCCVATDKKIQDFLTWISKKASLTNLGHKPSAIRAFYSICALDVAKVSGTRAMDIALDRAIEHTINRSSILKMEQAHTRFLNRALALANIRVLNLDRARVLEHTLSLVFANSSARASDLKQLRSNLLEGLKSSDFTTWWEVNGQSWGQELQQAVIQHPFIGHDWQFTDNQKENLKNYYCANKFLVELLKVENAASPEVRKEIEDNLLLPIAELKRRLPDQYGGIEES